MLTPVSFQAPGTDETAHPAQGTLDNHLPTWLTAGRPVGKRDVRQEGEPTRPQHETPLPSINHIGPARPPFCSLRFPSSPALHPFPSQEEKARDRPGLLLLTGWCLFENRPGWRTPRAAEEGRTHHTRKKPPTARQSRSGGNSCFPRVPGSHGRMAWFVTLTTPNQPRPFVLRGFSAPSTYLVMGVDTARTTRDSICRGSTHIDGLSQDAANPRSRCDMSPRPCIRRKRGSLRHRESHGDGAIQLGGGSEWLSWTARDCGRLA